MIERRASQALARALLRAPAATLLGPRQSGKTTLARSLGGVYLDLEQEVDRVRADLDLDTLASGADLVVFDEAQAMPPLFTRLRGIIDADRKRMGRFLLLGSVSPALMKEISQSLAGRLALLELTPLLLDEVADVSDLDTLWARGGFPDGGVLGQEVYPAWQQEYLTTLTRRDLPDWGLPSPPQRTERLLQMIAASHGQVLNASRLGQSLGLSDKTVVSYLDFLEGAFLVRRLPPFHANIRKRLVKRPKLFLRDSGLLHALMGVPDRDRLLGCPWVGASFEGFVIEQVLAEMTLAGMYPRPYFLRTSDGYEIDLVVEAETELWAIEVKLSSQVTLADIDRLRKTADMIDATRRVLVSRSGTVTEGRDLTAANLPWLLEHIRGLGS